MPPHAALKSIRFHSFRFPSSHPIYHLLYWIALYFFSSKIPVGYIFSWFIKKHVANSTLKYSLFSWRQLHISTMNLYQKCRGLQGYVCFPGWRKPALADLWLVPTIRGSSQYYIRWFSMPMNFILIARGDSGDPDNAHYFPNAQPTNNNNAQRPTPAQLVQRNLIYVVHHFLHALHLKSCGCPPDSARLLASHSI